jgi:hypothetical protein
VIAPNRATGGGKIVQMQYSSQRLPFYKQEIQKVLSTANSAVLKTSIESRRHVSFRAV